MADAQTTYVYGVLDPVVAPPDTTGIGGAPLRTVESNGLAALVSELPGEELTFGREELATHARVLEAAIEGGTVLPMRFGVVMEGEQEVRERLLDRHHDELRDQLQELVGKVELRVRATYEERPLMQEIVAEDPEVAQVRDQLKGVPTDASYYARIRLGELVATAVERKREGDTDEILNLLEPLALATRLAEPSHERLVFEASFLVERDRMPEFDQTVDDVGRRQSSRMRLKYTGPLPPHSFVRLTTGEA